MPSGAPPERLWGAPTQRSLANIKISGERMPIALLHALALVKKAAALVNLDLGTLDTKKGAAIVKAADEVLAGKIAYTPGQSCKHSGVPDYNRAGGPFYFIQTEKEVLQIATEERSAWKGQ
mgnify:CR=1 FL=1